MLEWFGAFRPAFEVILKYGWPGLFGVSAVAAWYIYRKWNDQKPFFPDLADKFHKDSQINQALDHMLRQFGCSRAFVYQYHNGQQNTAGIHFDKISMTHERVQVGVEQNLIKMQNIPNSLFSGFNLHILAGKKLFLPEIEDLKDRDMGLYQMIVSQGVRSLYLVGIFGFRNDPLGIVGIDYVDTQKRLCGKQQDRLEAMALKVCGLILAEKEPGGKKQ